MTSDAVDRVYLCECAARDGLQHEALMVSTDLKVRLINEIGTAGFKRIEAGSFSHPERVPQFKDIEAVLQRIDRVEGAVYKTTCVNVRAAERAVAASARGAGPDEISFPISANETANQRNTRRSIAESKKILLEFLRTVTGTGIKVTTTVSAAFGYPAEGPTPTAAVLDIISFFAEAGVDQIIIGDSDGFAYPPAVTETVGAAVRNFPGETFICHFHDNRGVGIANVMAALDVGVRHFDCSLGGIGGKPFGLNGDQAPPSAGDAPAGNVATEDLVCLLENLGLDTGVDLAHLMELSQLVEGILNRPLFSRVARSGLPYIRSHHDHLWRK
jgi:hydroxymethylglutaryl-CoA lyase